MTRNPLLTAAALLAAAVAGLPLLYLLVRVGGYGGRASADLLLTARTAQLAATSLALAAVVTVAALVIGIAQAWLVTRTGLPGRRALALLAALPLAVPSYISAYAYVSLWPAAHGFWPAAAVLTSISTPYVFLPVAAALAGADPAQEDVARSLGRTAAGTALSVTLRQVRPAAVGGGLLVGLYCLSDFAAVSILRVPTLTQSVFTAYELGFRPGAAVVLAVPLVVLTTLVIGLEQGARRRGRRLARVGAGVSRPPVRTRPGWWAPLALTGLLAVSAGALGVPAVNLAIRLVEGASRPGGWGEVAAAAGGSLTLSLAGAVATTALALPVGLLVARRPGRAADAVEASTYLAHALPGVVVGLSLVFFGINAVPALYQSVPLVALGYVALFLPLAVAPVAASARLAPPVLEDVAATLGSSRWTVLRRVTAPLVLPGLGAGAALVFLSCMKELPVTLLLRPTGTETLASDLWSLVFLGRHAAAAPYALLLVVLAGLPVWWLTARTGLLGRDDAPAERDDAPAERDAAPVERDTTGDRGVAA